VPSEGWSGSAGPAIVGPVSVAVVPYEHVHLDSILTLCREAGAFSSFASDRDRAGRALHGPGAIALVALRDGELVGFSHALTDGAFQAFLSLLLVHPSSRRKGIGRRLVGETLARCDAARLDLLSYEDAGPLYASFPHERFEDVSGFRIRPAPPSRT
jgi:GNAT superfamily N-acetyltransferase